MRSTPRRSTFKHSRLGMGRKKLHRWRAAVGRHSKVRKNRFGYIKSPRIGFKSPRSESGKINGKVPLRITNMAELNNAKKENILIIAKAVGARKRIEMIKKANEMKIEILNVKGDNNGSK
jgi:large subunit ribosomal protein L32e